jgi:hypothetical protein
MKIEAPTSHRFFRVFNNALRRVDAYFARPLEGTKSIDKLDLTVDFSKTVTIDEWDGMLLALAHVDIATDNLRKSSHTGENTPQKASERLKTARISVNGILRKWGVAHYIDVSQSSEMLPASLIARNSDAFYLVEKPVENTLPSGEKEVVGMELRLKNRRFERAGVIFQPGSGYTTERTLTRRT